jgi:TonB-linked SusC/RagA family outer membrane protein
MLFLLSAFMVHAHDNQDILDKRITLRLTKAPLTDAISKIEAAAQTSFFFDQKVLNGRTDLVTLDVTDAPLKTVLARVFPPAKYDFFQLESQIVVKLRAVKKTPAENPEKPAPAEILITGTVKNESLSQPMAGVTVTALPGNRSVTTDASGSFKIQSNQGDSIEFTYVGYQRQVIVIRDRIVLEVALQATQGGLDEVVVVGFGKQKKISLVGAQSTVDVEDLKQPVANLSTTLAGRIAGVVGVQRSGEPGRNGADIWIRGIATFNASNDARPLILIDGVERDINSLDPEDLQSVTTLKDASATAVYGVRGANGVILIKTKSGRPGKPTFNANYNEGFITFTRIPKLTDGVTYMNLTNEAMAASNMQPKYTQDYINKTASGEDPYVYPNVDWMDALFDKWSHNRRLNVSARGGSERANYYVSLAYYDEKGFLKTDGLESYNTDTRFRRYNFTSNLNLQLTNTTKFELGIQGYITKGNYPGVSSSDAFAQAMQITPVLFPVMYPGDYVPGQSSNGDQRNPYADITKRGFQTVYGNQLYTNARLTQDLAFWTPGLSVTGMYSFDSYNSQSQSRTKREDTYYVDQVKPRNEDGTLNLIKTWQGNNSLGYSNANGGSRRFYTEASVNYDREFGKHHVSGMVLFNQSDYTDAFAGDLVASIPSRYRGLAGRATYSWSDRYFVEGNFGYNGSENFAPNNRYGFFPSFGVGWIVSSEPFFKPLRNAVQFLKFRFSDGLVGAGSGGRRFGYLTFVNSAATGYTYGSNRAGRAGVEISDYGTEITWAESHKRDLGIEFKTFNSRLSVIVDLFSERRTGVFLQRGSLANFVGLTNKPWGNLGIIENKGIDMTVETSKFYAGPVAFSFRGNLTFNRDKVIENDLPTPKYPWQERRGYNYLSRFGLIAEGLFQSQEEIDKSPKSTYVDKVRVGDIRYRDLNGDGKIDSYDETRIGRGDVPAIVYGFGFNIEYNKLYFSTFFQGVTQADRMISGDGVIPFSNSTGADRSNLYAIATDRWTEANPNPNAFYPRLAYGNSANKNNIQSSSWWVKDISFIRLKTVEIGYSLPVKGLAGIGVKHATLFAQGVNLLTLSKFKLWDPELNTSNGTTYPNVMTISVGLQANF